MFGVSSFDGDTILGFLTGELKLVGAIFAEFRLQPLLLTVSGAGSGWFIIAVLFERGVEAKCLTKRDDKRVGHFVSVKLRESVVIGV